MLNVVVIKLKTEYETKQSKYPTAIYLSIENVEVQRRIVCLLGDK